MSGALTILVAKGQQDTVLTDNPQISFFRQNYKRHVNFSQAVLSQVIQGQPAKGAISTVTFDNKGDMLSYVYLTKKINGVVQPLISSVDIEKVEFIIGEQVIDTLTTRQLSSLQRFSPKYPQTDMGLWLPDSGGAVVFTQFHYPLGFWFCQNWQSAIPLVALQYHNVQIRITWGEGVEEFAGTSYDVWANYIYLDNAERDYITNRGTSDTLIYQHQSSPPSNSLMSILPFNNPVSFLFTDQGGTDIMGETVSKTTGSGGDGRMGFAIVGTGTVGLQINGVDIVEKKELYPHYNMIPCSYHTTYGKADVFFGTTQQFRQIPSFIYPFALNCSQLQPSGTCNFSRIDSAYLASSKNVVKPIHARSYNVLRIKNGMGGLLFSS